MAKMAAMEKPRRMRRKFTPEFKAGAVGLVLDQGSMESTPEAHGVIGEAIHVRQRGPWRSRRREYRTRVTATLLTEAMS